MSYILKTKITDANTKFSLFSPDDKILVALSGGADSVALLLSLKVYFPKLKIYAAHVNHMLRGIDADNDCNFCKELCENIGVPFYFTRVDVNTYSKKEKISTELAARRVRYNFFADICSKHSIKIVATAHTLTDNAETVLYNLTRGTSLSGLCGIPPKRSLISDISLVRPLIFATRQEIEEFLSERKQPFVTDKTNLSDEYTRNYFRHHIVPALKKINPSFEESLRNTCVSLIETNEYINEQVQLFSTDDINLLSTYDIALLKNIILYEYKKQTGKTLIESVHINKIVDLISFASHSPKKTFEVCLPEKNSAIINNGKLSFGETKRKSKVEKITSNEQIKLNHGINILNNSDFVIYISETNEDFPTLDGYTPFDKVNLFVNGTDDLYVRFRQNGDKIKSAGHTKKLKEMFIHKKIPAEMRALIPLVCDSEEILYVPGVALADKCINNNRNTRITVYLKTAQ